MTRLYSRTGSSRAEFFSRIGALREVDPLVNAAYKLLNEKEFAQADQGADAKEKGHVSFHGSEFPGNDPYACGRHAMYRMLDIPRNPFSRRSRQMMDQGKDFEKRLVWAWHDAGFLVRAAPDQLQTQFEDPAHWPTSSVDSILVKPHSNSPFIGEVKQVGKEVLESLRNLAMEPHPKYVRQVKCQIGMAHEFGPITVKRCHNTGAVAIGTAAIGGGKICPLHRHARCLEEVVLDPVNRGYLYYISRDDPFDTFEFMYEYDPVFMQAGRDSLSQWQVSLLADQLPQTNYEDKRYSHPFGWRWTLDVYPCKWCNYGDICRDDHDLAKERKGPISLRESAAVEVAERFRPEWSYEAAKSAVLQRWGLAYEAAAA